MERDVSSSGLIYAEECYEIVGVMFEVFNRVGYGYKESFYQKAIAEFFRDRGIRFQEQVRAKVVCNGKEIGLCIFDFLVFGKIVVEIKKRNYFSKQDIEQIFSYLRVSNLQLGILVHFSSSGVRYKRILNIR